MSESQVVVTFVNTTTNTPSTTPTVVIASVVVMGPSSGAVKEQLKPFLIKQRFQVTQSEDCQVNILSRREYSWTHIDHCDLKRLSGFTDREQLAHVVQTLWVRRQCYKKGIMDPPKQRSVAFDLQTVEGYTGPPIRLQTEVHDRYLDFVGLNHPDVSREDILGQQLCEMFAREPHHFLSRPADFDGCDQAWEVIVRLRHLPGLSPILRHVPSAEAMAFHPTLLDDATGQTKCMVFVPLMVPGSMTIGDPVASPPDRMGCYWVRVLQKRYDIDHAAHPGRYAKIEAHPKYQFTQRRFSDLHLQTVVRRVRRNPVKFPNGKMNIYEGFKIRESTEAVERDRESSRQSHARLLDVNILRSMSGLSYNTGHGTAELLPVLQSIWSSDISRLDDHAIPMEDVYQLIDPRAFRRVQSSNSMLNGNPIYPWFDDAQVHAVPVVFLEFCVGLLLDDRIFAPTEDDFPEEAELDWGTQFPVVSETEENVVWISGAMPLYPGYLDMMFAKQEANPTPWEDRLKFWLRPGFDLE